VALFQFPFFFSVDLDGELKIKIEMKRVSPTSTLFLEKVVFFKTSHLFLTLPVKIGPHDGVTEPSLRVVSQHNAMTVKIKV